MRYSVPAGLYALGRPGPDSPVIVTANYKLTFDVLRKDLARTDCWILVLETRGINVWCASAGGTLDTEQLVEEVGKARLSEVVRHRVLTVPQLCAQGVSAHLVQEQTGFYVRFGPVRSSDLPAYLAEGRASPSMRRVTFATRDRLVLIPMELGRSLKLFLVFAFAAILYAGLAPGGVLLQRAWIGALPLLGLGLGACFSGSLLVPLLLPILPGRAFATKGWLVGAAVNGALLHGAGLAGGMDRFLIAACWLFFPAAASCLALSFTGATTFTSPSGVRQEVRIALPLLAAALVLTAVALALSKVATWASR